MKVPQIMYCANVNLDALQVGQRRARGRCAVAYALASLNPQLRHISVDSDEIRMTDIDKRTRFCFQTPAHISKFIARWDRGTPTDGMYLGLPETDLKWVRPMRERTARDLVRPVRVSQQLMIDRPKRNPRRRTAQRPLEMSA
jgi:hypothetical protein